MAGDPGSMSAYARAKRNMLSVDERDGPGPAKYGDRFDQFAPKDETIPPFDITEIRFRNYEDLGPGPIYFPFKRARWQNWGPLFRCCFDRFHEKIDFSSTRCQDGQVEMQFDYRHWGRIPDYYVMMTEKILAMSSKRPRIPFEKYVSNNIPTIYHPRDIRCFIPGIDGRVYPWLLNRNRMAGPADYDTFKVYTSLSKITPMINFGAMSARKSMFDGKGGYAGPAGYFVRRSLNCYCKDQGTFLSKRFAEPRSSAWRLFDILERQTKRDYFGEFGGKAIETIRIPPCPVFEKCSPKACMRPFKPPHVLRRVKPFPAGPCPADHFVTEIQESDLTPRLKPGLITFPPEKAPFDTTEERFINPELFEMEETPSPAEYEILGFTDIMLRELKKHPPAIVNPKLGFLSSADARGKAKVKGDVNVVTDGSGASASCPIPGILGCHCLCDKERKWRNLRPRSGKTYTYFGKPPKYPCSPGPIYDTAPGAAAIKARKTWWDPRNPAPNKCCRTAFYTSGCHRKTNFFFFDKDVPGPGKYYSKLPTCRRYLSKRVCFGPRFKDSKTDSPGPVHKFHEKWDSSIWRGASHLGTFNSDLKHVGNLYPWSGGFIKMNMNQAGDCVWGITREDDYAVSLCPKTVEHAKLGHVYRKSWSTVPARK